MDKIFCYSGTGNCLSSAKQLASELDMEVVHITDELACAKTIFSGKVGIVIFPVYAYGMPKTVKRFILNNTFEFKYLAVLTTFGSRALGTYAEAIRLFRKRKQRVSYTSGTLSVENYVHMFKLPSEERIAELQQIQHQTTKDLASAIKERKTNKRCSFRPISAMISFFFRLASRTFAKRYRITDECTGCKFCYKICPANAIEMEIKNNKNVPKFIPKKCDHCQGCMQLCPKRAIRFGNVKPTSRRYRHRDVKVDEMVKR